VHSCDRLISHRGMARTVSAPSPMTCADTAARYKLRSTMRPLLLKFRRHSVRVGVAALFALAALALLAQTSAPAHVHGDGELGIYNEQCPLAASATIQRAGPPSTASVAVRPMLVVAQLVLSPSQYTPASPLALAAPRAPPLA